MIQISSKNRKGKKIFQRKGDLQNIPNHKPL